MFCAIGTNASSNKPPLSLESIFSGSEFQNATLDNIQWRGNGSSFTFTRRNAETGLLDMYEHNVKSGKNKLLISSMELVYKDQPIEMTGYKWSKNRRFLLITGPQKRTWDSVIEGPW